MRSILAAFLILVPGLAAAQSIAGSFEELRRTLKTGQTVIVTDSSGERIRGRVADVSPSSLKILVPGARTFAEGSVSEIRRPPSSKKGAIIGGATGAGLAIWDYSIDTSEPDNAKITAVLISMGTAIGAGIDAMINKRGKVIFRARPKGVLLSVRF
jgi:hypothetical protein